MSAEGKAWPRPSTLGADVDALHDELLSALDALLRASAIEKRFSDAIPAITLYPWK